SGAIVAQHRQGEPVGEQEVVGCRERYRKGLVPGRVRPNLVPKQARAPGLVMGDPLFYPIAELPAHHIAILDKRLRGRAIRPPALILQRLRQIQMIEGDEGLDACLEQRVHEPVIKIEPARVYVSTTSREDAGPGDREAVRREPYLLHERNVLAEAMVVV